MEYPNLYHIIREIGKDNGMKLLKEPNWSSVTLTLGLKDIDASLDELEEIAGMMSPAERVVFATGESQDIFELTDKYDKDEHLNEFIGECFAGDFTDAFFDPNH